MMMNDEPPGGGVPAAPAPDPAAGPAPQLPPPFSFAELMSLQQQGGPKPEDCTRLLFTCFHMQGQIAALQKTLKEMGAQHQLMTHAWMCTCKLNTGRVSVDLNVLKTISPKAEFDMTYEHRVHHAVFSLREPRAGIVLAAEMPKIKPKPKG